jgi:hypothetical protein
LAEQVGDQRFRDGLRSDHRLRIDGVADRDVHQVELFVRDRNRKRCRFVEVVILGGEPEEERRVRVVLLFQFQQRRDFGERVERAAGEADLLAADDGGRFAAGPALDFVADEEAPVLVGFDEGGL